MQQCDSIINKTPIASTTNKIIGGKAPSIYLRRLTDKFEISEQRLDSILKTHVINVDAMKNDDFNMFFNERKEALLKRIENATDKPIPRGEETEEEEIFVDNHDEVMQ